MLAIEYSVLPVKQADDDQLIYAGTGHRPSKLGGYGIAQTHLVENFATYILNDVLIHPKHIITGMALGWDQALAVAAIRLGIPFTAAIPFQGQDSMWPYESRIKYHELLKEAAEVKYISQGRYEPRMMQVRNEWMVDNCHRVLALWDGTLGGTKNCIDYANKVQRPIINVWKDWETFKCAQH